MRMAVIDGTAVINVIEAAEDFEIPGKALVPAGEAAIGWTYVDGTLSPPAPPEATEADINAERERRILVGAKVNIAGVGLVQLQGRPEDQINLLALKDTARDLKAAGVTAPIIPFRDGENIIRMFTADQMIEATDKGKMHVSAVYQAAWNLKAMDPVPADYASDTYWP